MVSNFEHDCDTRHATLPDSFACAPQRTRDPPAAVGITGEGIAYEFSLVALSGLQAPCSEFALNAVAGLKHHRNHPGSRTCAGSALIKQNAERYHSIES